jgi:hypothetical protein
MTTVYKFKAYYTDAGVGAVQDPAPTCTVINMADDSKLADAQATTASTNMPGLYSYSYSGADGLDCVAWFKTTDTGCDVKELASYVSEKITTMSSGVTLADDAITAAAYDESTAFPIKKADATTTELARLDSAASYKADVSAITGAALSSAGIDAILDEVVVGTYTMRQLLAVMGAALAGKVTGGGTTAITFRGINDASNVIVATVDANGNRSAVTVTV